MSTGAYRPFSDRPRESSIVSAYSGLADAAFRRLPERNQFLTALLARNSRYANATDPDTAFATDIRNFVERYPSPIGDTVRIQRGFDVLAKQISGFRLSTADTVAFQSAALAWVCLHERWV